MRRIGFLVFPDFQILDLSGPLAAFQLAGRPAATDEAPAGAGAPYCAVVLSETGGAVVSSAGLPILTERFVGAERALDTVIVVGGAGARLVAPSPALLGFLRAAAPVVPRMASVCTGAFVLAAAGLLDGRAATTHWRHAALLQRRYPEVRVDGDRIFTRDGAIWTSAGISAGIDLALAMIEADLGLETARATARDLVVAYRRPGGQSQFSTLLALDPGQDRIRAALDFARTHLHEDLPVERLAAAACLSPRQFGRAFLAETGQTPAKAIERLRAEAARARIEARREPIEAVARAVGFGDPERMRRAFLRSFGVPPQAVRRALPRPAGAA
ncbi:MAG: GlxA family transcriptional regulator [Rhodospirillales bacterium]|nr:GlxA family transcriptional regulator [Rhodospirillales bacterium]